MQQNKQKSANLKKDIIIEAAGILEELASALVMALLIIGFVIQPFIIPTGSMAETLNGAHFRLRCAQCGYPYDTNFEPQDYGIRRNAVPVKPVFAPVTRCPSCGYYNTAVKPVAVSKGDKILALKCIYQFFEPKRWDVVVFKNPLEPSENYIKRLIGKPGETVEIIDGDIYINGEIVRKPPKVQDELWMPIYINDYKPVHPLEAKFNKHPWKLPLQNYGNSEWQASKDQTGSFFLDGGDSREHHLVYDTSVGNDFHAAYAYNKVHSQGPQPVCSDFKVSFDVFEGLDKADLIGAGLRKYQQYYKAIVDSAGYMRILHIEGNNEQELAGNQIKNLIFNNKVHLSFAVVDHLLIFRYGENELVHDLGKLPDSAGQKMPEAEPEVEIIGSGELKISNVEIYRDICYTSINPNTGLKEGHAVEGSPFTLGEDEYFVLGDNSPASYDGRWWDKPGIGNNAVKYREGTVPRDYLVGKAFFVFWPSGFRPFNNFPIACVPNVGKIRLIYGGSKDVLQAK